MTFFRASTGIFLNYVQWDIRTYHLLDTCTSLDQCRSIFNAKGDIIYGGNNHFLDLPFSEFDWKSWKTIGFSPALAGKAGMLYLGLIILDSIIG